MLLYFQTFSSLAKCVCSIYPRNSVFVVYIWLPDHSGLLQMADICVLV